MVVIRKDPRKGYVRIKAKPEPPRHPELVSGSPQEKSDSGQARMTSQGVDLTLAYEQLSKMDPQATWYLHVSKKMLLNGTPKNPKMVPTTLTLDQIVNVVKSI